MVLEVVFSEDEKEHAQKTSKQMWDILYKDSVDPEVLLLDGGEGGNDRDSEGTSGEGDDEDVEADEEQSQGRTPPDVSESNSQETACTSVGSEP